MSQNIDQLIAKAAEVYSNGVGSMGNEYKGLRTLMMNVATYHQHKESGWESNRVVGDFLRSQASAIERANIRSAWFRENPRPRYTPDIEDMVVKGQLIAKAAGNSILDVGTSLNLASIAGGQAVGYMSLDTRLYRSTIRPNSFTLYNLLNKSQAFQVVDLWSVATDTGGGPAGTNFQTVNQGASIVGSSLQTSAGIYDLNTLLLALVINGRAITIPLASQNNFVDITSQETANAALSCLYSIDWGNYWGNTSLFPSQPNGIYTVLSSQVSGNIVNFWQYYTGNPAYSGLTQQQALFNLIYEICGRLTIQYTWSHITHTIFSPIMAADLQSLVTTELNNLINVGRDIRVEGIMPNGDLQGMKTRFGEIQFPIDVCIPARDTPVQAYTTPQNTNYCITTPSAPATVTAALVTGSTYALNNLWTSAFIGGALSGTCEYAVASADTFMNETVLTYSNVVSGLTSANVGTGAAFQLTIAPPGVTTNLAAYRIFRSGLGYNLTTGQNPASFRWIATVSGSTSGNVTYTDINQWIPGSAPAFMLDLDEGDAAIDYRILLPLTKVNLFADNIYMPWAVCGIGSIRLTIPRFHAVITNYPAVNPGWNPFGTNTNPQFSYTV